MCPLSCALRIKEAQCFSAEMANTRRHSDQSHKKARCLGDARAAQWSQDPAGSNEEKFPARHHTLDFLGPRFDECLSELLGSIKRIERRDRLDLTGANSKALRACDGFGAIGALKHLGEMQAVRLRGRSNGVKRAAQLCGGNEIGRRHRLKRLISCRLGFHLRQERGQAD
jgi:hypothetical protein